MERPLDPSAVVAAELADARDDRGEILGGDLALGERLLSSREARLGLAAEADVLVLSLPLTRATEGRPRRRASSSSLCCTVTASLPAQSSYQMVRAGAAPARAS